MKLRPVACGRGALSRSAARILSVLCLAVAASAGLAQTAPGAAGPRLAPGTTGSDLEERADRSLPIPVIIDALLSLPDKDAWRMVGDCARSLIGFKAAPPAGDRLAVQTGFFLFGDPDETYEVKRIQGAVLSYGFFANTCPPGEHQRDRDCFGEAAITVEVVSRDLIKMRQRPIRRDPSGYIPAGERSCTFHKQ